MTSNRTLTWLRTGTLLYLIFAAGATAFVIAVDNSVKAPLLTLIGTASLIVVLFPASRTITSVGAIMGTAIVMGGSGAWFVDVTQGEVSEVSFEYLLFRLTVAATVIFVSVALVISFGRGGREELSPTQSKSTDRKKAIMVLVLLSSILLVWRTIQSNLGQEERHDMGG